mgnify:CR=1 FL=1
MIGQAPKDAIKVVFHSAVLAHVDEVSRREFASSMRELVEDCDDVGWLSNEGPSVVDGIPGPVVTTERSSSRARFHLGRNGTELIALTDPHGRWIEWVR